MRKKKRRIEHLEVFDLASNGKGVARHEGKVVFINKTLPGDVVDVLVTKNKTDFMEARLLKRVKDSEDRSDAFCEHFNTCGGCPIQNVNYSQQLRYKEKMVHDAFERIAKVNVLDKEEILGADKLTGFRNKLEFTFSHEGWLSKEELENGGEREVALGFHVPGRFDKVFSVNNCHLQHNIQNEVRNWLRDYAIQEGYSFYNIRENRGLLRNLICRTSQLGETMIIVCFGENKKDHIEQIMGAISKRFIDLDALHYVINEKGNDSIHDLEVHHFKGKIYIEESLNEMVFKIRPKSFFQTNTSQALKLYEKVKAYASLKSHEVLYDLYTGTGTIANYLAPSAQKVVGIEIIQEAIMDAKENAERNKNKNAHFYVGDVKEAFVEHLFEKEGRPDVVIANPARAGMHADVIRVLLKIQPERIVYVSCNPSTQARDVAMLKDKYTPVKICPVDMFPHTLHVENVLLLTRND